MLEGPRQAAAATDCVTLAMIDTQERTRAYLERRFPGRWLRACHTAWSLAQQLEYLAWSERCTVLDNHVWREAKAKLSNDEVTAIVNRKVETLADIKNIENFVADAKAVTTGVLMMLNAPIEVASSGQLICHLLSDDDDRLETAGCFIMETSLAPLNTQLAQLPGLSFLLLAMQPGDNAISFAARDAFWSAMLGQP